MQAAPQNNNTFRPIHEAHSIEQVVFVLQFDRPLEDGAFKQVSDISATFSEHLPAVSEIQRFAIAFGAPGSPPPPIQGGMSYRKFAPNGILDTELRVDRGSITYITSSYTRWNPTWEKAKYFINQLLTIYIKHARVANISLNYTDKYVWLGDSAAFKPDLLIDSSSKLVSHNIFSIEDFWHSHTGAFYKTSDSIKRLLNFNIDALDEPIQGRIHRVISLTTVITDMLDQPNYVTLDYDSENLLDIVDTSMQSMHNFSKEILKGTLTQEFQKRIGLA